MKECICRPLVDEYGQRHDTSCDLWKAEWRRRSEHKKQGKILSGPVRP